MAQSNSGVSLARRGRPENFARTRKSEPRGMLQNQDTRLVDQSGPFGLQITGMCGFVGAGGSWVRWEGLQGWHTARETTQCNQTSDVK